MGGTPHIDNESGALWTGNFSPFNPSVESTSVGVVYETLAYINVLNGKDKPWLAVAWGWSKGGKVLTFTIRKHVTFSDGSRLRRPMSPTPLT